METNDWTPTQRRILQVLSDGFEHPISDLQSCLNDELAQPETLRLHLVAIRKKLKPIGQTILCERSAGRTRYRHVRIINVSE